MSAVVPPARPVPPRARDDDSVTGPAAPSAPSAHVVNVANGLTVLRLLLVPVFAATLFAAGGRGTAERVLACVVFAAASFTDRMDGELARRRNLVTDVGKIADPIADKALTGTALVGLSLLGELAWWVTVVVLAREVGVTLLRFWVIRRGIIPASRGGKLKTLLQGIAIGLYILPLSGWLASGRVAVMAAAVAVTLVTGVDYAHRAVRLHRGGASAATGRMTRTVDR